MERGVLQRKSLSAPRASLFSFFEDEQSHESIGSDEEEEYTTSDISDNDVQIDNLPDDMPMTISGNLLQRTTFNQLLNSNQYVSLRLTLTESRD